MNVQVETPEDLDIDDGGTSGLRSGVIRLLGSWRLAGIAIPFLVLFITLSVWSGPSSPRRT